MGAGADAVGPKRRGVDFRAKRLTNYHTKASPAAVLGIAQIRRDLISLRGSTSISDSRWRGGVDNAIMMHRNSDSLVVLLAFQAKSAGLGGPIIFMK